MKKFTVRRARKGDLESLVALLGELFAQEVEFKADPVRQRRALRLILGRPSVGGILVAEAEGRVVGMVSLLASVSTALGGPVAWLEDMVVASEWRGRGLGKSLVRAALAEAKKKGWRRLSLLTDADNLKAHALYRGQGFVASPMRTFRRVLR
ncbi:MAG TPA: GNAT family N-acetyltransferase [bacterium]|jgi:GNAT superfamily N-acetyltransferase|nr:GNAT family N-acetyltransferase [bacterium]